MPRFDRPAACIPFANGENVAKWNYLYDATGNLRLAMEQKSGWTWGVMQRDAAHRPTSMAGDNREAAAAYDARGNVTRFIYNEYPTALNGSLHRYLTVNYGYAADGELVARTGTVAQNSGGSTTVGSPSLTTSDEIDLWLDNYERGANLVAPPANRLGWVRSLLGGPREPGLIPICLECMLNPALGYGWAISSDNDDPFGIVGAAGAIRGWVNKVGPQCKPTQLTVEQLMADATSPQNDTGLSKLSRAWDKHSGREEGYYPPLTGNVDQKNSVTQKWASDLLNDPATVRYKLSRGGFEFRAPDGTGMRFEGDGRFVGVLNPRKP